MHIAIAIAQAHTANSNQLTKVPNEVSVYEFMDITCVRFLCTYMQI